MYDGTDTEEMGRLATDDQDDEGGTERALKVGKFKE